MSRQGWFADTSEEAPAGHPYQPCLQLEGMCFDFSIWFETTEECEAWIRAEVLEQGMYDETGGK